MTTVELTGSTAEPVTLGSGMNAVVRVTDPETQKLKVTTTKGSESLTKLYDLSGLELAE